MKDNFLREKEFTNLSRLTSPVLLFDLQLFAEEEKTEEATPHRRQEVRKKGQVAKSSDVNAAAVLILVIAFLFFYRGQFLLAFNGFFNRLLQNTAWDLSQQNLKFLFEDTSYFFLTIMMPVFLIAMVVGIAANMAQVGFLFSTEVIQPKFENINPVKGFQRMFSKRSLMELFKALIKVGAVGTVAYVVVSSRVFPLLGVAELGVFEGFSFISDLIFLVAAGVLVIFAVLAVIDYIFQRYEFNRSIRMSKYEVKQEMKQTEGDPQLKSKLRQRQRQMASQRMMHSVPEATVVITNPTHLAVALKYDAQRQKGAPVVVAKGADLIAARIKKLAAENNVPVMENKALAQALYKNVEIGQEIPAELYQAVAEVLAFIFRSTAVKRVKL